MSHKNQNKINHINNNIKMISSNTNDNNKNNRTYDFSFSEKEYIFNYP